jgi:hypothetical protein
VEKRTLWSRGLGRQQFLHVAPTGGVSAARRCARVRNARNETMTDKPTKEEIEEVDVAIFSLAQYYTHVYGIPRQKILKVLKYWKGLTEKDSEEN